ncbi:MAG: response regulator [Desulfobacterales bacterium]|nr:response regulator [Desulfobacterales bacterium]
MNNGSDITKDLPIKRILVVDDEPSLRVLLTKALARVGFICKEMPDAEKAWQIISNDEEPDFDLVISDISMPGMDGIELLKKVKEFNPAIDFIIMTGYASEYSYVDIMDAGASDYMTKPFNINSTLARIKRIAREKKHLIDLEETNEQLRKAMERANRLAEESKEASKAKTFFLAAMSHEIRTPLNGIVGYTDMLMDTSLDKEQKSFLESAKFSCDTLLSVVNDILDFSKVESGKLFLEDIAFDPEVLCFDTIDVVRTQVDESRVEILCRISDTVPGKVVGDPHRFRQVLLNLLGNAVKFTPRGSITLSLDAESVEASHTLLTIAVADTGIGISSENHTSIFEPFIQSEDDITSRYGGTGLGLAISRNIARKMGGDLWVESAKGKGSTFYFNTQLKIGEITQRQRIRPAGLRGKNVLVVSTGSDASEILSHLLTAAGMQVDIKAIGKLPLILSELADPAADIPKYDLGILDFGKSVKPGTRDIPALMKGTDPGDFPFNWMACAVPFPGIARIFDESGFKGFIPKPARKQSLLEMAAHIMGMPMIKENTCSGGEAMLTTHSLSENKKMDAVILLVEDNPVNQKMAMLMLTRAGYQVEIARHGKEALTAYVLAPNQYDLVLMDINMPVMDGFEATEKIRSHERATGIDPVPILALTANVLDDFKRRCRQVGMNDFLTKPIKREVVFAAIQKWVRVTV